MLPGPARSLVAPAWRLVLLFVVVLMTPSGAISQTTYHPCCIATPPPEAYPILNFPYVCKVDGAQVGNDMPNGTFSKIGIGLRVHTVASVAGSCEIRIGGVPYSTELRYINTVKVKPLPPVGPPGTELNITPNGYWQKMDSRDPGLPNGAPSTPSQEGKYRYELKTMALLSPEECNFVPEFSPVTETTINAMACRPE